MPTAQVHEALDNFLEMYGDLERAHEALSKALTCDLVERPHRAQP